MPNKSWPKTIKLAVERVIAKMSEEDKQKLRGSQKDELARFHFGMGVFIRNNFGLDEGNDSLMKACALTQHQGDSYNIFYHDDPDGASGVIINAVWKQLNSAA